MAMLDEEEALGEDTLELLATIEESFGIRFPSYREVVGKNVRELAEHISGSSWSRADQCPSSVVFYRLRHAFQNLFGTARAEVRPQTPIEFLLPWSSRRARWHRLQRDLDLTLPKLTYSQWLTWCSLAAAIAVSIGLGKISGVGFSVIGTVIGSIVLWICSLLALTPLARTLPHGCKTFGDFVRLVLARNYSSFASKYGGSSENEIVRLLRQLIAAELAIDPSEIDSETRIHGYLCID
jgi:hypothetical protein